MHTVAPPTGPAHCGAALRGKEIQSGHECVLFPLGVEGKGLLCVHMRVVHFVTGS